MPTAYKNQKYSNIKSDNLKKGTLYEDPEFPANNKSLFFSKIDNEIEWKRPKELCKVPKLVVEGVTTDDLNEGELGNTWFVSACASIVREKKLFQMVLPNLKEQEFNEKAEKPTYAGVFHFQFWRYGEWIDVVIDDRLPTKDGKLIFCHSKSKNEFWSALLEKAYAKLYGDYETLKTGRTADALVDFTGGVAEKLVLAKLGLDDGQSQAALFKKVKEAAESSALITCNIDARSSLQVGQETSQGLIIGHGYNVTRVLEIDVPKKLHGTIGSGKLCMVRLVNPWGVQEWNGPWSDGAPEWQKLNQHEWEKLGLKFEHEGEFWMHIADFCKEFTNVDICHFVNTAIFTIKKSWSEAVLQSEWHIAGRNGGSQFNSRTYLSNPQYLFDIGGIKDNIMVSLEQYDITTSRQTFGQNLNTIGFQIMKVEENRKYRVHVCGELMFKSDYMKSRSVFGKVELKKGRYVILPTTKEPGETGRFMLRLYTSSSAGGRELLQECPKSSCCSKGPSLVTTITVEGAEGLELPAQSKVKSIDAYVKILCEGEKVVSEKCNDTTKPTWNIKATFYRKKLEEPIVVEVWNNNTFVDDFMAQANIDVISDEEGEKKKCELFGRKKQAEEKMPGNLFIHICSSHDLQAL